MHLYRGDRDLLYISERMPGKLSITFLDRFNRGSMLSKLFYEWFQKIKLAAHQGGQFFHMECKKAQCYWAFSCVNIVSILTFVFGGDEGDRTPYLLTASQALSQVSYTPALLLYFNTFLEENQYEKSSGEKLNLTYAFYVCGYFKPHTSLIRCCNPFIGLGTGISSTYSRPKTKATT